MTIGGSRQERGSGSRSRRRGDGGRPRGRREWQQQVRRSSSNSEHARSYARVCARSDELGDRGYNNESRGASRGVAEELTAVPKTSSRRPGKVGVERIVNGGR